MPRAYRHMQQYENEMLELRSKGYNHREIGKILGFTCEQVHGFFKRYSLKQKKIAEGKTIRRKGRPSKHQGELPPSIQKLDKLSQMRYVMAGKDRYIKQLEMELELMRDFLSLTERM